MNTATELFTHLARWVRLQQVAGGTAQDFAEQRVGAIGTPQDVQSLLFTQERLVLDLFDLVRAL